MHGHSRITRVDRTHRVIGRSIRIVRRHDHLAHAVALRARAIAGSAIVHHRPGCNGVVLRYPRQTRIDGANVVIVGHIGIIRDRTFIARTIAFDALTIARQWVLDVAPRRFGRLARHTRRTSRQDAHG